MSAIVFAPKSTKRLCLRSLAGDDAADVLSIIEHGVLDFLPRRLTRASIARFLRSDGDHYVGAFRENALIGVLGLHIYPSPAAQKRLELSYFLARRATGCGLATEAAREIVVFGEKACSAPLVAQVRASNIASRRVLARLGFVETKNEVSAERGYRLMTLPRCRCGAAQ